MCISPVSGKAPRSAADIAGLGLFLMKNFCQLFYFQTELKFLLLLNMVKNHRQKNDVFTTLFLGERTSSNFKLPRDNFFSMSPIKILQ